MEAAFMEDVDVEVEAEEGLVDSEAALKTRPRSRSTTSTAVTTSVEPVEAMEGNGFQQGGGETERSVEPVEDMEGNGHQQGGEAETESSVEPVEAMEGNGHQQGGEGETERSVYFEGNDNNRVTMGEVEAEEGLVDNEAALETRPHSRSTTTDVTIIAEPVTAMEGNGSQLGGGETEWSIYFEGGNENGAWVVENMRLENPRGHLLINNDGNALDIVPTTYGISLIRKETVTCAFFLSEGIWKCHHCIWTYQMEGPGVDRMQNSKRHHNEPMTFTTLHGRCFGLGFEAIESNDRIAEEMPGNEKSVFSIGKVDSQKSLVTVHGQKRDMNPKDSSLYDLHHLPSEKSESSFEPVDNGLGEHADVTLLKNRRQEVTELDVERVILEQDTHDLYCPNCNSCITKRVILHKRKRTIRHVHYDAKREKIDTVVNLDGTNDEIRVVAESVLDSSPAPPVNDSDLDTGPDVFRCLSCCTYFIRTVRGFFETIRGKNTAGQVDIATQRVEEDAEALRQTECLPETLPSKQIDHLSDKGVHLPMDVTNQHGEDKALIQSECLPEILPVQEKDNLSNQGGIPISVDGAVTGFQQVGVNSEKPTSLFIRNVATNLGERQDDKTEKINEGDDVSVSIHADQDVHDVGSAVPGRTHEWDILKSIIYGGLIESITSLGVVSSAAASDATTLNIVILGLANLVSGFIIIIHNLKELKNDYYGANSEANSNIDRYQETLGRRENFRLHAIVALMSYIVFGLLPPVTYGFSFRSSNDTLYKLIACGAASLVAIILLSIGKAHVQRPPKSYVKTILYYLLAGLTASGLSYAVGLLIKRLLAELGWVDTLSAPSTAFLDTRSAVLETRSMKSGWAYYQ